MIMRVLLLSVAAASVQMPKASLHAQAAPDIVVTVDADGIREVRATFAQVDEITDAVMAVLTQDGRLRLSIDSPVSAAVIVGALQDLRGRGVTPPSVSSSSDDPTAVRLTRSGELVVTIDFDAGVAQLPGAFLRAVVPNNAVVLALRGPLSDSTVLNASRALEELGASRVRFAVP
jgi:biopolymer transport protein ExbD